MLPPFVFAAATASTAGTPAAPAASAKNESSSGGVEFKTSDAPPPGFSEAELNTTETNYISVYYGKNFLGNVMGTYDNSTIKIDGIEKLVADIPGILQPKVVAKALEGDITTNSEHLCQGANPKKLPYCSAISPEVAGVIFDPNAYRASIFVNPKYLSEEAVSNTRRIIADSTAGASYLANNTLTFANSGDSQTYSLGNTSTLGYGNGNLAIVSNYTENVETDTSTGIYTLQNAEVTRLKGDKYYQLGMFSPNGGGGFISGPTILGAAVQNFGVLPSTAQGNPVVIFLPLPSQVAIYKNGYLISTQSFDAGKQQLDTSTFPQGSYNLNLKITNNVGQVTNQTVFFVKQSTLPPTGSPNYQISLGVLQGNSVAGSSTGDIVLPSFVSVPLFTYSQLRKVGVDFGLQSTLTTTFNRAYLNEVLNYYGLNWQISPGVLVSNNSQYGWLLNLSFLPVSFPELQFTSNNQKIINSADSTISDTGSSLSASTYSPVSSASLQSTNVLNWAINEKTQLGVSESYIKSPDSSGTVQYGMNISRALVQSQSWSLNFSGSVIKSTGSTATIALQLASSFTTLYNIGVGLGVGYGNSNTITRADGASTYNVYKPNYSETLTKNVSWGPSAVNSLSLSANLAQSFIGNNNTLSAQYTGPMFAANMTYGQNSSRSYTENPDGSLSETSQSFTQSSGNFANNFAITGSGIGFGYQGGGNAGIMTDITAPEPVKADVYINGQDYGTMQSGSSKAYFVAPYQTYKVNIQPESSTEYGFNSSPKTVVLYQGNVARLSWVFSKQYILFAQIVDPAGKPFANALMLSKNTNDFNTTDQSGYVQASLPESTSSIIFKNVDGETCKVTLNTAEIKKQDQNDLVVLKDPLTCEPVKEADTEK